MLEDERSASGAEQVSDARPAGAAGQAAEDRLLEVLKRFVAETFPGRPVRVTLDADLERELGLDSLARVELVLRIGSAFSTVLPERLLGEARTARDILDALGTAVPERLSAGERAPLASLADEGVPADARTLGEVLEWHVARHPERLHVLLYADAEAPEEISYGALHAQAMAVATSLLARGLASQQTVALMLPTSREYLACFFGVVLAGAVPVPIYPPARPSQIEEHLRRHARILANAECAMIITVAQARAVADLLRAEVPTLREVLTPQEMTAPPTPIAPRAGPDDLAFLQYTSGSTGDPKGVMLTHANLLANIRAMGRVGEVGVRDVFVSWLPLYHDMGLIGAWFVPLYFGFPLVLVSPLAFLSRPSRWLWAIHRHRGTISGAPNFAYELLARRVPDEELEGLDLSSWRIAFNGAEPVSPAAMDAVASRFEPFGLRREILTPVYGLAECSVCLAVPPLDRGPRIDAIDRNAFAVRRLAQPADPRAADTVQVPACGRAVPGHAMRVVDDTGNELPERHVGRLQFCGPSATQGYFRNPEATRRLVVGDWRETGDLAYLAEGEVYLTGRSKDLIIRGGRNIYPYELEQAVGELPGVRRGCVAVFASPDPDSGTERLIVLAETRETDGERRAALQARISELAVDVVGMPPDEVVLGPPHAVLKTSSGKIRRAACREFYERGLIGAGTVPVWRQMTRLALSTARVRIAEWTRRAARWAYGAWAWIALVALGVPTWATVALLRRPLAAHYVMHYAARVFLFAVGAPFRARIASRLPAKPHVLVINHGSYLDAVVTVAALPPRSRYAYVAKREFADAFWSRVFFAGIGALLIDRFDVQRSGEVVDQLVAELAGGRNVVVFPEGTFTPQTGVRPFRMGAFVAAARADVPVVPAGLRGVREMLRDKTWTLRPGRPKFSIGAIIAPGGGDWADAIALRDAARAEIVRLSGEPDLQY